MTGFLENNRLKNFLYKDQATLIRSPERHYGLPDALGRGAKIREFGFIEALDISALRDLPFTLLVCLCIGFTAWYALAPEPLFFQPVEAARAEFANHIKDALSKGGCMTRYYGLPCVHEQQFHDQVMEIFKEHDVFDPLGIEPHWKLASVAAMCAAIIIALALGESVTPDAVVI